MDFETCYRAIDARDSRFDGQFVTAVTSTGIYCRPSCPARTPHRGNVRFFPTSAAAVQAGYRACKRCLPEAVPGTPAWNLRSDVAAKAMRLIADGVVERGGVSALASALGYSTRQLGRILTAELGAGPLTLARVAKAQTARSLLTSTDMKVADIAFASGFSSVRQFNDTIAEIFDLTPSRVRGLAHPAAAPGGSLALNLKLPLRQPYHSGVFAFLADRAVTGVEVATSTSYSRAVSLPRGVAQFEVGLPATEAVDNGAEATGVDHLRLTARLADLRDLPALLTRVRRLFDLDADPVAADEGARAALGGIIDAAPGMRIPGGMDATELLVRAMVGQQITVAAARTQLNKLAVLGTELNTGTRLAQAAPGVERLFPTAQQLAAHGRDLLRGPARRMDSIIHATELIATQELQLGVQDDHESLRAKLLPVPGIGPWTVDYLALRLLNDPDILLCTDIGVRDGLAVAHLEAAEVDAAAPWRSYAMLHLWRLAKDFPRPRTRAAATTKPAKPRNLQGAQ